ncbi:MAG: Glycosyl transferase family 2 [Candidatus Nomurabacteria bacterium GW2011_GWF1_31_48]|uniref:Glycosyl transferase family 2 n=2 Tax=Patescibacteria group TaxID=1783273 RepID=A0A0G1PBZ5_9BACT|nr:MAG: Glycosyl transferase family 2 [Candidatus Nomurabacteria bacterium GW2011_GWF1_31_48]KKU30339.1 MAG: Glycosyl transferase family 2 [Candidatus Collierbacteria bacterium GW2011_GWE1_46_18]HCR36165.1 hypothetical protein [Candidatus Woesebacteria bacterium]
MKFSKNNPLVSVIIPTKNNIRTIQRCLQSVKDQSYINIELIVVDNHSTDGTLEIATKFTDKVYTKGPERSAQRNFGASKAKGKYLLIHDSDIYFHRKTVEECVKLCEKQQADAVIIPEKSIGEGYWAKVKSLERDLYAGNDYIEAPRFFSTNIYKGIGGYNETLTGPEDWDLMIRIRENSFKILRAKNIIFHDEGVVKIFGSSIKKRYYIKSFDEYKKMHPTWYKKQVNIFVRYPANRMMHFFIRYPIKTVSMIIMKGIEYLSTKIK